MTVCLILSGFMKTKNISYFENYFIWRIRRRESFNSDNIKSQTRRNYIDGVYAQCPYISNPYDKDEGELKSLTENDTYFLRGDMNNIMASLYNGVDSKNPLAWPYHADKISLRGLPPHVISLKR